MRKLVNNVLAGCGVLALALAANAQTWGRDPYYGSRNDGYYRGNGSGSYNDSLISRVMSDLNRAASGAWLDGHERHHFDEVARSLEQFQDRWARGRFDTGKLDKAIDNLKHLAGADRVRGRDRDMLARDIEDLRQFRATRGGYGYDPRYRGGWR